MDREQTDQLRAVVARIALENKVRVVLHRWYTCYEREDRDLALQAELITDDISLILPPEAGRSTVDGRDEYLASVRELPRGQAHTHHLETLEVIPGDDGTATGVVTHGYETAGPQREGAALLRYRFEVVTAPGPELPRLTRLHEDIVSLRDTPFVDAYAENRVKAFVYRWLVLVENPTADTAPLRELVADDAELQLSDGRNLTTWSQVADWYTGSVGQVDISAHKVDNLTISTTDPGTHQVSMDFTWYGLLRDGQVMTARTHHEWSLLETAERYLRLHRFTVTATEPFTPVTPEAALTAVTKA